MYQPQQPPLYGHPARSYQTVATQTASRGRLVVMLYDGAICFLERALTGFQETDPLEFNRTINNNILRAQEIINELNGSLDLSRGGELAVTLRRLYVYMGRQLTNSNVRKQPDGIQDTIRRLTTLRDSWHEAVRREEASAPQAQPYEAFAASS